MPAVRPWTDRRPRARLVQGLPRWWGDRDGDRFPSGDRNAHPGSAGTRRRAVARCGRRGRCPRMRPHLFLWPGAGRAGFSPAGQRHLRPRGRRDVERPGGVDEPARDPRGRRTARRVLPPLRCPAGGQCGGAAGPGTDGADGEPAGHGQRRHPPDRGARSPSDRLRPGAGQPRRCGRAIPGLPGRARLPRPRGVPGPRDGAASRVATGGGRRRSPSHAGGRRATGRDRGRQRRLRGGRAVRPLGGAGPHAGGRRGRRLRRFREHLHQRLQLRHE